ncbi:DNA-directed DNA polymerase [Tanacetum coccineum]
MSIQLAGRSIKYLIGVCENLLVKISKFIFPVDFVVLEMDEDELVPIILGRPFLATTRAVIDVHEGKLSLTVGSETVTFKIVDHDGECIGEEEGYDPNKVFAVSFYPRTEPVEPLEWKASENQLKPSSVEPSKLKLKELPKHLELLEVLWNHKGAIAWSIADIKGIDSSFCTHKILMEDDFKPSVQPQRRVNPNIKEVVKKKVIKLLDAGLIYPISDSPWVSPVQVIPKKGGMTVVKNEKDELIPCSNDWLGMNKNYFLDGFSRYFQIPITPEDQEKTTFTYPYGTFAYKRMPFGLCNAPATFQRCMTAIFHELIKDSMEVFMDDFSVFGSLFDHCLKNLETMLKRFTEANLVLNWEKCHFMVKEGIVLGHKVLGSRIEVDKAKIEAISKLPYPTNVKAIQRFLGHAGFYRRFIKDFLQIARPMTQLLVKDAPFNFSTKCIQAFNTLKLLGQRTNKHFKPIHYASKIINEAQENYTTTEKELLAVVFAFDKFRKYLVLSKTIEFDIEILDKKGAENLAANQLSRLENLNLGKLTRAAIRDLFPEERLMEISDKNNEPWMSPSYSNSVLTESYKDAWPEMRQHKFFDNVMADHLEDIMASPPPQEKSLRSGFTGHISFAMHVSWSRIDFVGLFPSSNGNKYVLVVIDYVSKWVEAQAFPTNDARNIVNFLKRLFSTAYHPQTNGQVENTNRAIKRILEKKSGTT